MKKIVFATCSRIPNLTEDDRSVVEHLRRQRIQVEPLVWNAHDRPPRDFEIVVIRSCWDYHFTPRQFLHWTSEIQTEGIPLWNPASVVEWNLDKVYLRDLEERGVSIPPTVWLERRSESNLAAILHEQGWEKAIVKPAVSATAFQTWRTSPAQARSHQDMLEKLLETSGVIVQRFVDEIQTRGEWSLIFFLKEYSHAVLKRAKPGDFRVQEDFGGFLDKTAPSASLIEQAQRIVELIEEQLLFARVDGVEIDGNFQLMELELIEPALFLLQDPLAARRFSDAIGSLLEQFN